MKPRPYYSDQTTAIWKAMQTRFCAPAWALFQEVSDSTGHSRSHSADAVAMSLWPSRGLDLHGFEFKSYRGDWLRELKNPQKADAIAPFCDFWSIVAFSPEVCKAEELPREWGLFVLSARGLHQAKAPLKREQVTPVDRPFLAALLRRAHEVVNTNPEMEKARQEEYDRGRKDAEHLKTVDVERAKKELAHHEMAVKEFEKASGISWSNWNAGRIGEAVGAVLRSNVADAAGELEDVASLLEIHIKAVRDRAAAFREAEKARRKPC